MATVAATVVPTRFGFERQFFDVTFDAHGRPVVPDIEVVPKTPGNWVRVIWVLPPGYRFAWVGASTDDFRDPAFEFPDFDPAAPSTSNFVDELGRRFGWTARKPGKGEPGTTYTIVLDNGVSTPNLKIVNKS